MSAPCQKTISTAHERAIIRPNHSLDFVFVVSSTWSSLEGNRNALKEMLVRRLLMYSVVENTAMTAHMNLKNSITCSSQRIQATCLSASHPGRALSPRRPCKPKQQECPLFSSQRPYPQTIRRRH